MRFNWTVALDKTINRFCNGPRTKVTFHLSIKQRVHGEQQTKASEISIHSFHCQIMIVSQRALCLLFYSKALRKSSAGAVKQLHPQHIHTCERTRHTLSLSLTTHQQNIHTHAKMLFVRCGIFPLGFAERTRGRNEIPRAHLPVR